MGIQNSVVKNRFGKFYKVQLPRESNAQLTLKSEYFWNDESTQQFINNLTVPNGYWREIINEYSTLPRPVSLTTNAIEQQVSALMIQGQLKLYPVDIPDIVEHPPEKRVIRSSDDILYRFAHISSLLLNNSSETKRFKNTDESNEFISGLNPTNEQLITIANELNIEIPNTASVNISETLDALSEALVSGTIVIIVDEISSVPSADKIETGNSSNNKEAGLGAHDGEETVYCDFSALKLKCSHSDRGYQLDAINSPPNLNGVDKVIQVIAKPGSPDKITVDFSGSCVNGVETCPSLNVTDDSGSITTIKSPYEFDALPKSTNTPVNSFMDFIKYYLVPDINGLEFQTYNIKNEGCSSCKKHLAKIHAFPTFKWGGSVNFGYIEKDKDHAALKLAVNVAGNIGEQNWAFETSSSEQISKYFPGLHEKVDSIVKRLGDFKTMSDPDAKKEKDKKIGLVKFDVKWPNISLGGNIELKEAPGSHEVDLGGDVSIGFNPLIQANVRTDILDWFIVGVGGPFGEFLRRVKIQAAKGVGTKKINAKAIVAMEVVVTGSLASTLKWEKNAKEKWLSTKGDKTGEASASLNIGLEGKIQGETQIFRVKITMGAELHLKGATSVNEGVGGTLTLFATTAENKPAIGGNFKFTGAALYYTYYAEVGSASIENKDTQGASSGRSSSNLVSDNGEKSSKETKLKEDKLKKLHQFFDPAEWPKSGTKKPPLSEINF